MNLSPLCLFKANPGHVWRVHEPVAFSVVVICDILSWILNTLSHVRAKKQLMPTFTHTATSCIDAFIYTRRHTPTRLACLPVRGGSAPTRCDQATDGYNSCVCTVPLWQDVDVHTQTRAEKKPPTIARYVVHKFRKRKKKIHKKQKGKEEDWEYLLKMNDAVTFSVITWLIWRVSASSLCHFYPPAWIFIL